MDTVTIPEPLVRRFLVEAQDDEVGLWEIVKEIEPRTGPGPAAMEETLAVARFWRVASRPAIRPIPPMAIASGRISSRTP